MKVIFLMLMAPFCLFAQQWETNYETALTKAKNENKQLLLVFAGSDWCAQCIKLDKEIWQSEEFTVYARDHYVLYKADFPRKKSNQLLPEISEANKELAERFNPKGYFPLVVLFDSDENILGKTSYKKLSPKEYIAALNSLNQ